MRLRVWVLEAVDALLAKLLEGIDPNDPEASRILFGRLMGLVDWWMLIWLTLACTAVGGLIGWYKGAFWKGVILGATLGPIGWVISLIAEDRRQECPSCSRGNASKSKNCLHCGVELRSIATSVARVERPSRG